MKPNSNIHGTVDDIFKSIQVIDTLKIDPITVTNKKITVPYTTQTGNKKETIDLLFTYEEEVFDPDDESSLNLANMIGAQVALNYGLFCKNIVFTGSYDTSDQRFIQEMMENTSREIFVKKILEDNPFIVESFSVSQQKIKRERFTQARLIFESSPLVAASLHWNSDRSSYCVLSSGGKDSLLSFSLLNETQQRIYPIFVNESGRHWFTALNAYRYFQTHYPNTKRVWTNSDRVFSWMLRKLPFIRQDFSTVRSDEYPIRLWTVAVFLFAVLPLVKKYRIGRIIIGDEYDTTGRYSRHGIAHYNGLYDQSRYFDNALTRFFRKKQWHISQFSLLRPLSELLIEKTLYERYPNIQKQQMSCHATHIEQQRVRPCGNCEKCRRIVAMLTVIGADPKQCGYTNQQITQCLKDIIKKGIHQEKPGMEHLYYLLIKQGLITPDAKGMVKAVDHPEILKLRFEKDKSPPNTLPLYIRQQINTILMGHSLGAVYKHGKIWLPVDPLRDMRFSTPYLFESSSPKDQTNHVLLNTEENKYVHFSYLTWPEAKKVLKEVDLALLPVGAIEQHGSHLPLDTDAFDADYLAIEVAKRCSHPKPIVLPVLSYGVSYHHDDFSGTISISPDTLSKLVYEIGMNLARQGITKIVIINGHGGNTPALKFAAQLINRDANVFTTVDTGESSDADISSLIETIGDVHSGEIETSTSLALRPELVQMDKAHVFVPAFSNRYLDFTSKKSVEWYARTSKISPDGTLGDPTKATAEKGKKIWELMIKNLVDFVEDIKNMSLDEIYQRRY